MNIDTFKTVIKFDIYILLTDISSELICRLR